MSRLASSIWNPVNGGITLPSGFRAAGIAAGLKNSGKKDLALLQAPRGAVCAGTFTTSLARAACIDLCRQRLRKRKGYLRAVLINSGQANACTGQRGLRDSRLATKTLANKLNLLEDEVLICSTGVIGEHIPIDRLITGLDPLIKNLSKEGFLDAAEAILTTDLCVKQIAYEGMIGDRKVRIGGMAKGSGMIHPSMATMLSYLTCDVGVSPETWNSIIQELADSSFNAITVDGDTSTNDSFLAFAAGEPLSDNLLPELVMGLKMASQYLAKSIARDGEGANCLMEVNVNGANTTYDARHIARTVCSSALVKTAIHGADPNWGRIVAAIGRSGIQFDLERLSLWIGSYQLLRNGLPTDFNRVAVSNYMKDQFTGRYLSDDTILIRINLGKGECSSVAWGCDLSDQYVHINADYTT